MIRSFGDRATEDLYHNRNTSRVRRFPPNVRTTTLRKLDVVDSADDLMDLRVLPGNRLQALKGDLKGFHSIRVTDQWRIVFRWHDNSAYNVSLIDYH